MKSLKITSCQAPNLEVVCCAIADYIGAHLQLPQQVQIEFVNDIAWQERFRQLDAGHIHVAWICGAHYVRRIDKMCTGKAESNIELLAAPVWQSERYQDRPVYFSDIVVHQASFFRSFADLHGATWAYNEPGSLSGYEVMRYYLNTLGKPLNFFGKLIESGAHQQSLQMILARQADVAAIDSTMLEQELSTYPAIASQIRTIDVIGPNPMPPWVIALNVPAEIRSAMRSLLTTMHEEIVGRAILAQVSIVRFAPMTDSDYDPVRTMLRMAAAIP